MGSYSYREKNLIKNKYYTEIKGIKGLGVILVEENGFYELLIKPIPNEEVTLNQEMLKLAASCIEKK